MRKAYRLCISVSVAIVLFPTWSSAQLFVSGEFSFSWDVRVYDGATAGFLGSFVPEGSLGLTAGLVFGPDGNLYVSSKRFNDPFCGCWRGTDGVLRYDGDTGAFLNVFVSGDSNSILAFGPDKNLYVYSSRGVLRYDGATGAFHSVFVPSGSGGLFGASTMLFGPDGNLYIANSTAGGLKSEVLRYHGVTGAFLGAFVTDGSGGLKSPLGLAFGPNGHVYVSSQQTDQVLRYNGSTGAFLGAFVPSGSGGLRDPTALIFGPDGALYVSSYGTGQVLRYNSSTGAFLGVVGNVYSRHFAIRPELPFTDGFACSVAALDTYATGEVVVGLHIVNYLTFQTQVEVKLWWSEEYGKPLKLKMPLTDKLPTKLPVGYDHWWKFFLGTADSPVPRGRYQLGCRLVNPVTGRHHSQGVRWFTVQ